MVENNEQGKVAKGEIQKLNAAQNRLQRLQQLKRSVNNGFTVISNPIATLNATVLRRCIFALATAKRADMGIQQIIIMMPAKIKQTKLGFIRGVR